MLRLAEWNPASVSRCCGTDGTAGIFMAEGVGLATASSELSAFRSSGSEVDV